MKIFARLVQQKFLPLLVLSAVAMAVPALSTQNAVASSLVTARVAGDVSSSEMAQIPASKHPMANAQFDAGRLAADTKLQGITLYFSHTPSQEASLRALLAAQQNPSSSLYHQWLTPEQFAASYGLADADIAKVQSWLEQQGFSVDSVSRSKTAIHFSGTARQVEEAFSTEMHNYTFTVAGKSETHFAPSTALSVPAALGSVVLGVRNLDSFRPKSHLVMSKTGKVTTLKPKLTWDDAGTEYVFFAPGDIATVYDINNEYSAGYTGTGQSITIVGQSEIEDSDIKAFESAAGLPTKAPVHYLMPNTGAATVFADGDETESDLDVEWSGAVAKGAIINFVYTGSNTNAGTFDALEYAIDQQIGTIISSSYGTCEAALGGQTLETVLAEAATQGQTVLSASGDSGSTDCYGITGLSTTIQEGVAVDYPASSQYVTGVGGTEIQQQTGTATYETPGDGYWATETTSGSVLTTSALQYIPEQAWNEDAANQTYEKNAGTPCSSTVNCLAAGGGGASTLFVKPGYQTALTPADGKRDVPDVSLNASTSNPGYLFCSSDETDWSQGQAASCNNGFLDTTSGYPTVAGGTSFATPIFAGMTALINQQHGYTSGQGQLNYNLYSLAGNSTTYTSAFHDITVGNNDCDASGNCSGTSGFSAGTGYDQATGLGTVDVYNLASANGWPAASAVAGSDLISTTTTISASSTAPTVGTTDTFTVTVAAGSGSTAPTGSISITVDGGKAVTEALTASSGASASTYVYSASFTTAGSHVIEVNYPENSTFAASSSSVTVSVAAVSSGTGTFTLTASPTSLTVAQGSAGTETITITPKSSYTGTVDLGYDSSNDTALANLCLTAESSVAIGSSTPVTTTVTLDTNAADCPGEGAVKKGGKISLRRLHSVNTASNSHNGSDSQKTAPVLAALAGFVLAGFMGRYSKRFRSLAGVIALVAIGLAISACGGSSSGTSTTSSDPAKGTYTITVTGQDSATSTITSSTPFTFVID